MERAEVNVLAGDMFALYEARSALPDARPPRLIDIAHYADPAMFADERRLLFHERPLMLGFSVDLPAPGSVKTNDYLDVPVLLVRDKAGRARAFANICRHRGGRLVDEPSCMGTRRALTCRYHGWVYGLDGQLKSVQQEALFGPVDKAAHGLIELPCDEKYGMIFARPRPGEPVDIDALLGAELAAELAGWNLEGLHLVEATSIDTPANWKVQIDTFLESYHVESLHADTIAPLSLSGYALHRGYGDHQRLVFTGPGIKDIGDAASETINGHKHLTIVYMLFPNIFIVYGPLFVQYFEIYPGRTIDSQRSRFALYARKPPQNEAQREAGGRYFDLAMSFVPTEDYLMGQQATRAVLSGVESRQMFGQTETGLDHFHRAVRVAVGRKADDLYLAAAG